jgi:hypothetical protein
LECQTFSLVVRIGSDHPQMGKQMLPTPLLVLGGGGWDTLVGEGVGGANSDEGTDTLGTLVIV